MRVNVLNLMQTFRINDELEITSKQAFEISSVIEITFKRKEMMDFEISCSFHNFFLDICSVCSQVI